MQILIGCAKTMTDEVSAGVQSTSEPEFQNVANELAIQLAKFSPGDLQSMLHVNPQIAGENWHRFQGFFDNSTRVPAVFAYDGMVFKKLSPETMSECDLQYANGHLNIASFLYGLLRPLDLINCYRLEGNVELHSTGYSSLFDFWKPILTDRFIEKIKEDDGILINLASNEFKSLFDWRKVTRSVKVISPEFKVEKDGKLKTVVIYAKMCRGAMSRWIIQNRITDLADLKKFEFEGFEYKSDWCYVV